MGNADEVRLIFPDSKIIDMTQLEQLQKEVAEKKATLIAVSKTKSVAEIQALYDLGQRDFGENRVQELQDKQPQLPADVRWHLIGHLQTNKVKYVASFVHLVHSVDSLKLLAEINKQAEKEERIIPCLLQFKIAEEESKFGLELDEGLEIIHSAAYREMQHIRLSGVMGMATFTEDLEQVRREFKQLRRIFETLKYPHFEQDSAFREISMGMSGDYEIALEEGSTMVRIGSLLFGAR